MLKQKKKPENGVSSFSLTKRIQNQNIWRFFVIAALIFSGFFMLVNGAGATTTWKVHSSAGFTGATENSAVTSMAIFNSTIYASVTNAAGSRIFRQIASGSFEFVATLGSSTNIPVLAVFGSNLYAGTTEAAGGLLIYRTSNGTDWPAVSGGGFGDANNTSAVSMEIFDNRLNVGTRNTATGTEVWSCSTCDGSDWTQVGADGLGNANNTQTLSLKSFGGRLVAGTYNSTVGQGGEVRYYDTGTSTWIQFNTGGFGDTARNAGARLEVFGSNLYAGTERTDAQGLEIWYSRGLTNNWTEVVGDGNGGGNGFGNIQNTAAMSLYSYTYETSQSRLVVGTRNTTQGGEIWESTDGTTWSLTNSVSADRVLNNSDPTNDDDVRSLIAKSTEGVSSDKHLYAGILNSPNGAEVWQRDFAPIVAVSTPSQSTDGSGYIPFTFEVDDYDGDTLTTRVQLSTTDGVCTADGNASLSNTITSTSGTNPTVTNGNTYQISNIVTTSASGSYTISGIWKSQANKPDTFSTATCLSMTAYDSFNTATTQETDTDRTNTFTLDNVGPNPPTLNDVTSPTKTTPQTISGTKDANTSVVLNGTTLVSSNANTTWSRSLALLEGTNSLSLTSKDNYGNESSAALGSIILDTTAPATCSADPAGGTYTGKVDVELEAGDALDPDPYVYYTTNDSTPTTSSQKFKDKGTVSLTQDATIKFFCQDWLENKTSVKSEVYVVTEPQISLTKTAQVGSGAMPAGLALGVRDILLPSPQKSWQNISALAIKTRGLLKVPDAYLYKFLRGFTAVVLGLALFYLILVFDAELKIKGKKRDALFSILRKNYGKFAYVLPVILAIFIFINLFIGVSLIAQNIKVKPNDTITYTLAYENTKNKKASDVEIADTLPDYVDYVSGGTLSGSAVNFNIGDLSGKASGSAQFSVKVKNTAKNAGLISNTAAGVYGANNVPFTSNTLTHEVEAQGKISGYVFYDSNADKVKNSESGISGVSVKFYEDPNQNGILDNSDPLISTKTTNSAGYFEMANAYAAFYLIKAEVPSGYQLTTSSNPAQVVLKTSLEEVANVNFGYLATGGPTPTSTPIVTVTPTPTETPIITETPTITPIASPTTTPIIKKITEPITKTTEKVQKTIKKIQDKIISVLPKIFTDPITQKTTKNVAGPLLFLLPLLNLLSAFPSSVMWQFLRYLIQVFSEPFIYFGKGARRNWGVVFNSLTKQPIDLATVRLFDKASGKLLESKVTDFEGRYMFIVDFGREYYLQVQHRDYVFPSKFLARVPRDSDYNNIYHGEAIATGKISDVRKKEQGIVTFNIPLDPNEGLLASEDLPHKPIYSKIKDVEALEKASEKKRRLEDRRIVLAMVLRKANFVVGFLGPFLSLFSLIIAPSWITLLFLVLHLLLLTLFLKLAKKKVSLPWGKTFELKTKEGLAGSIVRLFDEKYGRMLSVAVTKGGGRYGFLCGRENYILMAHKPEYILPQGKVKVHSSREKIVKEDLGMEKSSQSES